MDVRRRPSVRYKFQAVITHNILVRIHKDAEAIRFDLADHPRRVVNEGVIIESTATQK